MPFKIKDLPAWVRAVPDTGVIVANEIRDIRFEVDSSLAFGLWTDTITLHTVIGINPFFMGGDERLPLGVRVVCRPPDWDMDAGLYQNSMNLVLKPIINGKPSKDVEDIVAAYIGNELRGRAYVEYVPQVNQYLAYLTVYGEAADFNLPVHLEVWDASECLRYGSVAETFNFGPDVVVGIPNNPQVINTNNLVLREIPLGNGWNWISFNLKFPDSTLNAALASLQHPENDLIRSQTQLSTYFSGMWPPPLLNLVDTTMYIYRADQPDTLKMLGQVIDPATKHIHLKGTAPNGNWNWIGYIPNYALPINTALSSLQPEEGNLIKSQMAFAQYLNGFGWVGNLKFLQPPNGYQIKLTKPGVLTYPPKPSNFSGNTVADRGSGDNSQLSYWTVDPTQYEHSMTLIGILDAAGTNGTTATMELGAFAGNEVRGAAPAVYIEPLDAYQFFLTSYANMGGEQLHFKLYDSATGQVQNLVETMYFTPNQHQGSIEDPVLFHLPASGSHTAVQQLSFDVQPNPFHTETLFRFSLPYAQEVALIITDANGREVSSLRTQGVGGLNTLRWNGTSNSGQHLSSGVYFACLRTAEGIANRKVILQR